MAAEFNITHYDSAMGRAGGVSFYDFNGDGFDDLTLATGIGDSVLFYISDGCKLKKIPSIIDNLEDVMQVLWADIDNDGDKDLCVTSYRGGARLYENQGGLNMVDISINAGIDTSHLFSYGANFADYNNDGFLDLYINNYIFGSNVSNILYRNNGNNTFTDVTKAAGLWDTNSFSFVSGFFDYDKDGWIDVYVTTDKQTFPNQLYRNNGNGTFSNVSLSSNTELFVDAMSATVDDYNNDGWLDFLVTNTMGGNVLLHNNGNGTFTDTAAGVGVAMNSWAWGAAFLDAENDGDLDLYINTEINWISPLAKSTLYENSGSGQFTVKSISNMNAAMGRSYANSIGDYNDDGFIDIAVVNLYNPPFIWENISRGGNFIKVELEGTVSNKDGVGTYIYVYSGSNQKMRYTLAGESFIGQFSQYEIIGLGNNTIIDSLVVVWPSGLKSVINQLPVNQRIKIIEGYQTPNRLSMAVLGGNNLCIGDSIVLMALNNFDHYSWNTGDTSAAITVDSAGTYILTAFNNLGPVLTLQTTIVSTDLPNFNLGPDTVICDNSILKISGPNQSICYEWSDGSSVAEIEIEESGLYWLKISKGACEYTDSISIDIFEVGNVFLGNDTVICAGDSLVLDAGSNWDSYYWSDNSIGQKLTVKQSGNYLVEVTDSSGCINSDVISVLVDPCLSVEEFKDNEGILIIPVPADDFITISLMNEGELMLNYTIFNIEGSTLKTSKVNLNNSHTIDLSGLNSGLYLLLVESNLRQYRKPIIIN